MAMLDNSFKTALAVAFTILLQTSAVAANDIKVTSIPENAKPGDEVTISVKTAPNSKCSIDVQGEALTEMVALVPKDADKEGKASWTFKISNGFKANCLPVIVTAAKKGEIDQKEVCSIAMASRKENSALNLSLDAEPKAVKPQQDVTVAVNATPGANCKIEAQGEFLHPIALKDKKADKKGHVSWTFKLGDYKADKLPVIITGKFKKAEKKLVCQIPVNRM